MLTFYYAPGTCAVATHLALEAAGAPYQAVKLDFKAQQQRTPEYLKVNPKGRVPALATERGVLTETPALLQYVAQSFPQSGLAPLDDIFLLAKMNEFNSYLCSTVHPYHAHKARSARWADDPAAWESMQKKAPQNMADGFALMEEHMVQGPWVLGDRFSTSDLYLFTIGRWLPGHDVDVARYPKVAALMDRLQQRPQVQKVLALHA